MLDTRYVMLDWVLHNIGIKPGLQLMHVFFFLHVFVFVSFTIAQLVIVVIWD